MAQQGPVARSLPTLRIDRNRTSSTLAARLAAVLLAGTCLTPILPLSPALAGGTGGDGGLTAAPSTSGSGGTGSSGLDNNAGGSAGGTSPQGAGVGGGLPGQDGANNGGNGSGGGGGGGNGVSGAFAAGNGGAGVTGGGAGGAGGSAGQVIAGSTTVGAPIGGGSGVDGTAAAGNNLRGGGGGGGGDGAVLTGAGSVSVQAAVQGGAGGAGGGNGFNSAGGSGGGGGAGIVATGASTLGVTASSAVTGGAGGAGGAAGTVTSGGQSPSGGGGGGGGAGIALSSGGSLTIGTGSQVTGGAGGAGGTGAGNTVQAGGPGGGGGGGGAGVIANSASITNSGTIAGGTGGAGGAGGNGTGGTGTAGSAGAGGAGIVGSGITVINSGTITAGSAGGGGAQANAITFTGGTNTLTLQGGSTITGNVVAFSSADTLTLGGTTNASFDVSQIGSSAQYRNFGVFGKTGTSVWTLTGAAGTTMAWTVSAGTLRIGAGGSLVASDALAVNGGTFDLNGQTQTLGALSGTGGTITLGSGALTAGNASNTTLASAITGAGSFTKQGTGTMTLTGTSSIGGGTSITGGTLVVNGGITSNVTIGSGGTLGGSGTITGLVTNNGTVAPGNSIGTLNITGNYVQNAGTTYQVEVNAAGQSDRINATGTATINGGTVQVLAESGNYARSTTYTILNATGGVTGTYATVTSNFAFLTPTLSYDSNNVFLTLLQSSSAFASGAQTANQFAVGTALDRANPTATGDFNTVLNALSSLNTVQGPAALNAISGQNYSGFGTANVQSGLAFMNVLGQQMSLARGGSGGGTRVALAEACDVTCDSEQPSGFSVWGSALGGTGGVAGNGNAGALTYNLGGFATGVDYRLDPRFLVGIGLGFASGNQWVGGFNGRGTSNSYNGSLYASFTPGAFYIDTLAGYGYSDNQMTRMIAIPGLAPRTAQGRTGANQFTGQAEAGYRVGIYEAAAASLTPFARFQTMSVNQNGFSETGANSLNLSVAQQATTSVRTVLGAELAGALDLGWRDKLALQLRLGWAHEYADTSRPVTAAFAGAPGVGFTVYGAAPQRDAAVIGLAANTAIAQSTALYLRYDGEVGTGTDNHVLSAGFRMTW